MEKQGIVVSRFGNCYTLKTLSGNHIFLNTDNPVEQSVLDASLKDYLIISVRDSKIELEPVGLKDFIIAIECSEGEGSNGV